MTQPTNWVLSYGISTGFLHRFFKGRILHSFFQSPGVIQFTYILDIPGCTGIISMILCEEKQDNSGKKRNQHWYPCRFRRYAAILCSKNCSPELIPMLLRPGKRWTFAPDTELRHSLCSKGCHVSVSRTSRIAGPGPWPRYQPVNIENMKSICFLYFQFMTILRKFRESKQDVSEESLRICCVGTYLKLCLFD